MAERLIRVFGCAVAVGLCLFALDRLVAGPFACNRAAHRTRTRTERTLQLTDPTIAAERARVDVDDMSRCLRCTPASIEISMNEAANLRILGRNREAVDVYRNALRFDRRPELYMNLGETLIQLGERPEGMRMLLECARFLSDEGEIDYAMSEIPQKEEVKALLRASDGH